MPNTVEKIRVHNALVQLGLAGPYYAVTYDPATKLAQDVDEAVDPTVVPASCQANEITSRWEKDQRHGRNLVLERTSWVWALIVKFNQEVTAWRAEETWAGSPLILPRDANFPTQVTLKLIGATYQHPIKQGSHNGSLIEFNFEARRSRR